MSEVRDVVHGPLVSFDICHDFENIYIDFTQFQLVIKQIIPLLYQYNNLFSQLYLHIFIYCCYLKCGKLNRNLFYRSLLQNKKPVKTLHCLLKGHACAKFSTKFQSILSVDGMSCEDDYNTCPFNYNSTDAYQCKLFSFLIILNIQVLFSQCHTY